MNQALLKQCVAEFIGTFALIFVGVISILSFTPHAIPVGGTGLLAVALAHGLTIAVMASAVAGISGGHLNPAVTLGLVVGGQMDFKRATGYWISQLLGGYVAALLVAFIFGTAVVARGTPGIDVSPNFAILIEAVLTFFLVFVVFGTAVDSRGPKIGALAIGLTVTIDILVGGPFTGGAMNPARAFGPALVCNKMDHQLVYWIGPLAGGAMAGLIYGRFLIKADK